MKVQKFPQSHLVITNDSGKKLIIDPGYLTFKDSQFQVKDFQGADLYLITHQHADHLGPETIKEIVGDKPIYGNLDVINKLKEYGVNGFELKDGQVIEVEGFTVKAVEIPHFKKEGIEMPPNTGYVVDGILLHPGDGWELQGLKVDNAAIPISSPPGGELQMEQGLTLAKSVGAKVVIPIHDNFAKDPKEFAEMAKKEGIRTIILSPGEETII